MNIQNIKYFLAVVHEMSFSRAAEKNFTSQQVISSHIKKLEDEFGVILFERRPKLKLTLEGQQLKYYSERIISMYDTMEKSFSDINSNSKGQIKFGISRLRSSVFFTDIWREFHTKRPNIAIELIDGNTNKFHSLLLNDDIDLYLGLDVPIDHQTEKIDVAKEKLHCVLNVEMLRKYYKNDFDSILKKSKFGIDLLDVKKLPIITLRSENALRKTLDNGIKEFINPNYILECDEQDLIFKFSELGYGLGILSPVTLYKNNKNLLSKRNIIFRQISNEIPFNKTSIVYKKRNYIPDYIRELISIIISVMQLYNDAVNP